PARSAGRTHVPAACLNQDFGRGLFIPARDYLGAATDASVYSRPAAAGVEQSRVASDAGALSAHLKTLSPISQDDGRAQYPLSGCAGASCFQAREPIHAPAVRRRIPLYAHGASRNLDRSGDTAFAAAGSYPSRLP